jgi:ComF family protein
MAPPDFERAVAYGVYEDRIRDAIHAMKYGGIHSTAGPLGRLLAAAIGALAATAPSEMLVVPVPLHRSRHAQRGFNQARLLAMSALEALQTTHPGWRLRLASNAVIRLRQTASQASLTPRRRRLNLRGAFRVADPKSVAGCHILVIDDVFTTGATARAVAAVLRRAGAASVWVATLARAHWIFRAPRRAVIADLAEQSLMDEGTREVSLGAAAGIPLTASMQASPNQPSF